VRGGEAGELAHGLDQKLEGGGLGVDELLEAGAQGGDLVVEVGGREAEGGVVGGLVGLGEGVGVEAVGDGVSVAGLAAWPSLGELRALDDGAAPPCPR